MSPFPKLDALTDAQAEEWRTRGSRLKTGKTMAFDPSCIWTRNYLGHARWPYERQGIAVCRELAAGGAFLDIGANIGIYTVHVAEVASEVHSFEPVPDARDYLLRNLALNGLSNVTVHPLALSNEGGQVDIAVGARTMMSYIRSEKQRLQPQRSKTISVERARLDDLELIGVSCVKVDVEGHEWHVLQGARETLARNGLPPVFFEHDEKWLKRAGVNPDAIFDLLRGLGYGIFLNKHWEPHSEHPENNILALGRPWEGKKVRLHARMKRVRDRKRERQGTLLEDVE